MNSSFVPKPWTRTVQAIYTSALRGGRDLHLMAMGTLGSVFGLVSFFFDLILWLGCYCVFALLRADSFVAQPHAHLYLLMEAPFLPICVVFFTIGAYDRRTNMISLHYVSEHVIGGAMAALLGFVLIYSIAAYGENIKPSRSVLGFSFLVFTPVSLILRRTIFSQLLAQRSRQQFLVLGAGKLAQDFFRSYQQSPSTQQLRFVSLKPEASLSNEILPVMDGDVHAALKSLGQNDEAIIIAEQTDELSGALLDELAEIHFRRVPVYTLETFYEKYWRKIPVTALEPSWPLRMGFQLVSQSPYAHAKRLFDLVVSGLALVLLSPLLAFVFMLTILDSGRPAMFLQTRVGLGNKPFTIFKFRTMRASAVESEADLYTCEGDPRITRLGYGLRKLRLDELPQLWNVFKGDMTLIGPRAEWSKCVELYNGKIPFYHLRHMVKPGITGWAQINYPYGQNAEDALQKLNYDLYYIRNYSLRLDAMIFLKTLHVMLWGKGQ